MNETRRAERRIRMYARIDIVIRHEPRKTNSTNSRQTDGQNDMPTSKQITEVRQVVLAVGRSRPPKVVLDMLPMRKHTALLGLRILELEGQYSGFSRRPRPNIREKVEKFLQSRTLPGTQPGSQTNPAA